MARQGTRARGRTKAKAFTTSCRHHQGQREFAIPRALSGAEGCESEHRRAGKLPDNAVPHEPSPILGSTCIKMSLNVSPNPLP